MRSIVNRLEYMSNLLAIVSHTVNMCKSKVAHVCVKVR